MDRTPVVKKYLSLALFFCAIIYFCAAAHAVTPLSEPVKGTLLTVDGVRIAYERYKNGFEKVIIICPGFYNSKKNRWMRKTADFISSEYDVIIFDLRGHGESGGEFTWSAKEHCDLNAVIDYAIAEGYKDVGLVAFSLGAASAINAASARDDIGSMVLISTPSSFRMVNFHFWEPGMLSDLKDNIECKWEGKGARFGSIFTPKDKPIDTICLIKSTPILFIHGDNDWLIKDRHSEKLYEAARVPKKIEIIKGGLHAERIIQFYPDRTEKLILEWFSETL